MTNDKKSTLASSDPAAVAGQPRAARSPYVAPCVEEDLPLEVMSLACSGFVPKGAGPLCRTIGSLRTARDGRGDDLGEAGGLPLGRVVLFDEAPARAGEAGAHGVIA